MKSKVKLSTFSMLITSIVLIAIVVGIATSWGRPKDFIPLCVVLAFLVLSGMFYSPLCVRTEADALVLHRFMKDKVFPYTSIVSIERCYPSAGGLRMCGSGGFMGYWGYFHDIVIGSYFGYYGNHKHCFLLRLKGGSVYVIGCENPDSIIKEVKEKLSEH